jgi:hypothetical protein
MAVQRPAMVIDCAEIGKSKSDAALIDSMADQTGKRSDLFSGCADPHIRLLSGILLLVVIERLD